MLEKPHGFMVILAVSESASDQRERARGLILSAVPARYLVSETSQRLRIFL